MLLLTCRPLFLAQAYTACEPGEDPQAVLAPIIKGRGLAQVTQKMLDHPDARQVGAAVLLM
jgi:hypothetical protein